MANLPWPNFDSSTSTATSTTNPNLVDSVGFSDDLTVPNPAVSRNDATELEPTVSETTFSSGATTATNPEGWASAQGWDKYRALITELYPKLMLKEIMEVMEYEHSFKATEKMYKSRFTQWGLRKNAKRKCDGNQESGREKRPIDRCSPLLTEHAGYLAQIVSAKTSRALRSSTPLPRPVITPPMLAIPERILSVIWDYFRGSFEAGIWVANGDERDPCRSTKSRNPALAQMSVLRSQTQLACRLFDENSFQDAGKTLISATAGIEKIIFAEEPRTLIYLFKTVLYTHYNGRDEIAFAILRQFSAMAMAVLGDRHPLCRILGWLSSMDSSRFNDVIERCLISVCDHFASLIGHMHSTTLLARLEAMSDTGETEEKLRDLLGKCENDLGSLDFRSLSVRLNLLWVYSDNSKYTEAKRLGQELVGHCRKLQTTANSEYYRAEGLYIIAESEYALGQRHLAESHILEAIALISPIETSRAMHFLSILEDWLLEQGREESAAETRERRRKLQESIESGQL